jgi:AraC-like DNA-binding protein
MHREAIVLAGRQTMKNQYEIEVIEHPFINNINVFLVNLDYRTPHLHDDIEVILVLGGQVNMRIRNQEYHLGLDSCVLFNSLQPHDFHSDHGGTLILCLQVSPKFCSAYFPAISSLQFDGHDINQIFTANLRGEFKSLLLEIACQYYAKDFGYEFSCISLVNQLFWLLLKNVPSHILTEEERKANIQKAERLNRILSYIDENYMNKILLTDIAERENLSMPYLSHFFKDNLNQTFQEYLMNLRFSHARDMIMENRLKLIDICLECGFSDYRYLYQAFLKNYGCTPREYQKLHNQAASTKKYRSPQSLETFYTFENARVILEDLHKNERSRPPVNAGF